MPTFGPVSRRKLIQNLKLLKFDGPFNGGNHQYLIREQLRLVIPNPHQGDISTALLAKILK